LQKYTVKYTQSPVYNPQAGALLTVSTAAMHLRPYSLGTTPSATLTEQQRSAERVTHVLFVAGVNRNRNAVTASKKRQQTE